MIDPISTFDPRQYKLRFPAEGIDQYCPGGYHPTHLGDLFKDGQYKILHKLGFGSSATVWMARDNVNERNVSIKIIVAKTSENRYCELDIFNTLKIGGHASHPGRKHVVQLLDWFEHDGPNGRHLCLVTDLLGLNVNQVIDQFPDYRLPVRIARRISRQLLYATHYLHACGVAHGDIQLNNLLFRFSDSKSSSSHFVESLGEPHIGKVSRHDEGPLEKGVPKYLVDPASYKISNKKLLDQVKLIDFGESFLISSPPKLINTLFSFHPPELVFRRALSGAVDIWNLGCTTYQLVTTRRPFEVICHEKELIPQFQVVLGAIPEKWVQDAFSSGKGIPGTSDDSAEEFRPLEQQLREDFFNISMPNTLELNLEDFELLLSYLRRMLVIDPEKRASLNELITEPWIFEAP